MMSLTQKIGFWNEVDDEQKLRATACSLNVFRQVDVRQRRVSESILIFRGWRAHND
jgi:hypothetical protein